MSVIDRLVIFFLAVVLIVGGYQFYFWCQRRRTIKNHNLITIVDHLFGYNPQWVWIYAGLYYVVIFYAVLTVPDIRNFAYMAFSYLLLLLAHMIVFVFLPVTTPSNWRKKSEDTCSLAEKFLSFLQQYDAPSNCFPSMHVSVSTLTALHILRNQAAIGNWVLIFPVLIGLSAIYVKQHYFLDLLPGAFLGWLAFKVFDAIVR